MRLRRRLAAVLAGVAGLTAACSPGADPSAAPTAAPPRSAATAIEDAVDSHLERRGLDGMRALLVAVDGRLVVERYWHSGPQEHADTLSVTKTITGTLVGAALADGSLRSLDQTLAELLPERAAAMAPETAAITVRQLLTMTAGLPGDSAQLDAWTRSQDWVGDIIATGTVAAPGSQFEYANASSHLLAAVLAGATGLSVLEYARQVLFDPLGIETRPETVVVVTEDPGSDAYDAAPGFVWPQDPQGLHTGFGWAKLTARDMLALGQLYLDDGRRDGEQVVPATWVTEATASQVTVEQPHGMTGYGYHWWTTTAGSHPAAVAWGFGGQLIEVVPDLGLVVVVSTPFVDGPLFRGPAPLLGLVDKSIAPAADRS